MKAALQGFLCVLLASCGPGETGAAAPRVSTENRAGATCGEWDSGETRVTVECGPGLACKFTPQSVPDTRIGICAISDLSQNLCTGEQLYIRPEAGAVHEMCTEPVGNRRCSGDDEHICFQLITGNKGPALPPGNYWIDYRKCLPGKCGFDPENSCIQCPAGGVCQYANITGLGACTLPCKQTSDCPAHQECSLRGWCWLKD